MKSKHLLLTLLLALIAPWAVAQQALPYSYGFEDNDLATDGWTTANPYNSNTSDFGIVVDAKHDGDYGFQFSSYYRNNAGYDQYLFSPELNGSKGLVMTFWYAASSPYGTEIFKVGYSTTDTNTSSFTWGDEISINSTTWTESDEYTFPVGTKYVSIWYYSNYQYRLYVDDFSFNEAPSCLKPLNLAATTDGVTATLTWEGTAANGFIIDINGTQVTGQSSPYTFDVALSTTYNVTVTADCDAAGTSDPVSTSFTTPDCIGGHTINYTLTDSYGDGWTGSTISAILVYEGCGDLVETITMPSGSTLSGTLTLCGDYYEFVWQAGQYPGECSFTFTEGGTTLFTKPSNATDGMVLYTLGTQAVPKPTGLTAGTPEAFQVELSWTENGSATAWEICVNDDETNLIAARNNPFTLDRLTPDTEYTVKVRATDGTNESCWSDAITFTTAETCAKPTNLAETNITTNSATLSWNGTSERYVLQYRPWTQVGEDHLSTEEFVTYTYDLSEFKGQGSIAIRHYDVTDVFYLNVDNVELKADDESTIFFEDFESGSIPSTWTNYDVDGDGYTWDMAQTGSMNVIGNYGVYSASWLSGVGALTPDNWLIISNVELGGTFSFAARGQDPNFPAENFAVYVSMESDITEVAVNGTSYNAENLTPATPYAWQVKGDCGEYQSNWVTSLFKTKDDAYIFATDGDWDDLANWTDAEGNPISELPTVERKVRVNAEAIIPAGVVATAGKTTINGGSITVKDGGELKHNTATLWVTMEKDIEAYTIEQNDPVNNIQTDGWYFISTPFSGTTEIEASGEWSHVNNLAADGYDLYGFDPTADQEWINYEAEPEHAVFTAGNNHGLVFKRGYLYASDTDRTVTFTGTISKSVNNSMTETFDYDGTSTDRFNGWALVGNPFSCSTYINYVDGEDVLEADFYVMNADGNGYELSQSSVALAPLTGAFINYSATGTVQFSTENNRAAQSGLLNMTVSQGRGNVDMARVRFGRGHNLKHMSFRNNSSKLFIPQDNDYAVVYTEENAGEMPVNFKAENNGTYTISFNTENISFNYLHLIDNMTGNDVNLLTNPSYSFEAKTTDYASRFKLVFATGNNTEDNFAFMSNGNLIVSNEGEATLQVIDVNGRILRNESINGSTSVSMNNTPGVYMLRLINGNDVKVQKIVVK